MRKVLASKITIPTLDADIIQRKKLYSKLVKIPQFSMTVMTAGAGYGKTTSLVQYYTNQSARIGWYNIGAEDDNFYFFSIYLAGALDSLFPGLRQWYYNKLEDEERVDWKTLLYHLMIGIENFNNEDIEGFLVVDDWQYAQKEVDTCIFFDRFLANIPSNIHFIILSREYVNLPEIERLRIKGNVLDFFPTDLLFSSEEVADYLSLAKLSTINKQEIDNIWSQTEGWAIVIKLLANQWKEDAGQFVKYLSNGDIELDCFFKYLSLDVFNRQSAEVQEFLMKTSLVESFDLAYCKNIVDLDNLAKWLNIVIKKGLFISRIGEYTYRYNSLFKEFLRREAEISLPGLEKLYVKIGRFYCDQNNIEWALHFFILGEEWQSVSELLSKVGRHWVICGRQKLFSYYLEKLPLMYQQTPQIYIAQGDMERFSNSYEKAVYWYKKAAKLFEEKNDLLGWSNSCRGLGEVYLDIIQPNQAQQYLHQAYKLLELGQEDEKGALLYLMSENMINHGNSCLAERYLLLRKRVVPFDRYDNNNLQARIFLRTGRIKKVIEMLEKKYKDEDMFRIPCSFRESSLILSLCYCFMGNVEYALKYAQSGIEYADKIQAPFIAVVGYVRAGHAHLLDYRHTREICHQIYDKALSLAEELGIERGKTEIYWGQCVMAALDGNWQEAEQIGLNAVSITENGHDYWFTAMLYHTLGMGAGLCVQYKEGEQYSKKALSLFKKCGDTLGQSASYWQLTYQYYHSKQDENFIKAYEKLLECCNRYSNEFLLKGKTFLGDMSGFTSEPFREYYETLNFKKIEDGKTLSLPTPSLYIKTLGTFKILRKGEEISPNEWHRKAAKQLFFLLITMRAAPVSKEQLMVMLWPDADNKIALSNFKVVLNHLINILEPNRRPRVKSKFIFSKDTVLQLIDNSDCQIDVQYFTNCLNQGIKIIHSNPKKAQQLLLTGLKIYEGEYLAGEYLDDVSLRERDRLQMLAVRGSEMLAFSYVEQKQYEEAIIWADHILQLDNCWEQAYQIKLTCYGEQQKKYLVERVFRNCVAILKKELGVEPSEQTQHIYSEYQNLS